MRFKIKLEKEPKHSEMATGVGWCTSNEVYSCGDDQQILSWKMTNNETITVAKLHEDLYPTDLHWCPISPGMTSSLKKQGTGTEMFALASADGKFHLVTRPGRIEKSVDAHKGAVLVAKWSHDGMALITGGEDGQIKIWSRSGMLRSTLVQSNKPIYSLSWGPDSNEVVYTNDKSLCIKPLQPSNKPLQWLAHEGLILKVDWGLTNNLILSGGEDCKYMIWDCYGRQIYCSSSHENPITSLAWSPDGELFAIGSFNLLRLCDKVGWCHNLEKPKSGSIFSLAWSADSTQIVGACGGGHVIFAHLVERKLEWKNYEAVVNGRKSITVCNVVDESWEKLEFKDRIIKTSMGYNHLIVATTTHCHIYSTKNWNTPIIFESKEGNITNIILAEKHFMILETSIAAIYSYEGRPICVPRWSGMRLDALNNQMLSLNNDLLAVRDKTDEKVIHIMNAISGKPVGDGKPFVHKVEIIVIGLNQQGSTSEQILALVDKNRDLYLVKLQTTKSNQIVKIAVMVQSLMWNDESNMLAAQQDAKLIVWYNPGAAFVDHNLLSRTALHKESSEFGKAPQIVSFIGNQVNIRRSDGSLTSVAVSPYPVVLHSYVATSRWEDAIRLCRFVKDEALWACLAAFANQAANMEAAEIAYANLNEVDKVEFIQNIKTLQSREAQLVQMALLRGSVNDAESIFLQAGLILRAIMMHIKISNWARAFEMAAKHKNYLDIVVAHRSKYLERMGQEEYNTQFQKISKEVKVDWNEVNKKFAHEIPEN